MKLYEIATEYQALLDAIENGEIPEEAIADTLESVTSLLEDKADNVACVIKNMQAEVDAIKAEEDRLATRRKVKEKRVEYLTKYLSDILLKAGYEKVETARNKITFRKNPPKVFIENEKAFIEWALENRKDAFLNFGKPTVNKTAIKQALADGEEIEGACMESSLNIQIK